MKKKDTPSPISTILITNRQICYVCVGLQLLSSKPAILPTIRLIWLPWQPYIWLINGGNEEKVSASAISTIVITEIQNWYYV